MTQTEARAAVGKHLEALAVACDALQTAAFQETDYRWRRVLQDDKTTWPPLGGFLFWDSGRVAYGSSRDAPQNSSGRIFSTEHYESKWPDFLWWMTCPPAPPEVTP